MSKAFIKVEFDPMYNGDEPYVGSGMVVLVPEDMVKTLGMKAAFEHTTLHSSRHIIRYYEEELVNADGSDFLPIEETPVIEEVQLSEPATEVQGLETDLISLHNDN